MYLWGSAIPKGPFYPKLNENWDLCDVISTRIINHLWWFYKSPKEEVSAGCSFDDGCQLVFMAHLVYGCTAGYHNLRFWPFDIQIKILFHVSLFSPQRGATIIELYESRQRQLWKRGFDHIRSIFAQVFITIPIFPIMRGVCVSLCVSLCVFVCGWSAIYLTVEA